MGHKISKEQIDPGVKDYIMSFVGDINELETDDKSNIINAVNSLMVDRVDNAENMGKLANAIGEPVTANHSVDEVVEGLGEMLSTFKTNMMNNGVTVESGDRFKALIDKIATLADSEGKGIQFAEGKSQAIDVPSSSSWTEYPLNIDIDFSPTYLIITVPSTIYYSSNYYPCKIIVDGLNNISVNTSTRICINALSIGAYYNKDNDTLVLNNDTGSIQNFNDITWYAIGVGEEDTTLRDSLASILQEEGVSVTEEDDMASLITKVDEEFDRQVVPAGDAVASNVLSGKTFINSTGQTITGTMTNRGGAQTVTPGTSNKTLNSGYYSGNITVQGDSNLIAENIVSGKSIFGVSGTAASLPSGSNIIYNSGTINTNVIGGFDFFMEDFDSIQSSVTYNNDSIELASVINSGGATPNADYIISHRAIRPYPYTKLRLTYKTIASEESDYYRAFYSVDFAKFTPSTGQNDGLLDYKLSFPYSTGLYGIGLYDDYTEVTTVDIDIPDNLDPFFLVFRAQHINTAANTLRLVIYKIELL